MLIVVYILNQESNLHILSFVFSGRSSEINPCRSHVACSVDFQYPKVSDFSRFRSRSAIDDPYDSIVNSWLVEGLLVILPPTRTAGFMILTLSLLASVVRHRLRGVAERWGGML